MTLSEAIEVVGKMLRGYANGGKDATAGYIGALAEVLAQYPRCVAMFAGDPFKGVPRETKFLPSPADIIAWAERETDDLRKVVDRDDLYRNAVRSAAERREGAVQVAEARKARPSYDELKAKYGPNWGITNPDERKKWTLPTIEELCIGSGISRAAFEELHAKVVEDRERIKARGGMA